MATPREAYQLPSQRDSTIPPSAQQATTTTGAATTATTTTGYTPSYGAGAGATSLDTAISSVTYICGECASKVALNLGDAIRCKECGHRVLYKGRTKR
jgi:DNA-directed RNA polymerases I, II, and III subunit RPABC4